MRQVIVKALLRLYCWVILLLAFTDGGPWNADAAPFASPGFLAATDSSGRPAGVEVGRSCGAGEGMEVRTVGLKNCVCNHSAGFPCCELARRQTNGLFLSVQTRRLPTGEVAAVPRMSRTAS